MKTLFHIVCCAVVVFSAGCSKKQEAPKPPVEERLVENPQSNYGKAVDKARKTVEDSNRNNEDFDAVMEE